MWNLCRWKNVYVKIHLLVWDPPEWGLYLAKEALEGFLVPSATWFHVTQHIGVWETIQKELIACDTKLTIQCQSSQPKTNQPADLRKILNVCYFRLLSLEMVSWAEKTNWKKKQEFGYITMVLKLIRMRQSCHRLEGPCSLNINPLLLVTAPSEVSLNSYYVIDKLRIPFLLGGALFSFIK